MTYKNYFFVSVMFWVSLLWLSTARGTSRPVTQPIGTLVRTWNTTGTPPFPVTPPAPDPSINVPTTPIGEVNYICAQWDPDERAWTLPFDIHYPATEIVLTQPQHFVRLLVSAASSSSGAWIMRSEYVRGLTPAQLRDVFALANDPIEIVNVEMPVSPDPVTGKSYALWTGIAAPIRRPPDYDWGDGGAVQNRLITDAPGTTHYFPDYMYTSGSTRIHRQPVGAIALSYVPLAGNGNERRVAAYLDTFVPVAYSDLETVYTSLDYLNYIGFGGDPLQAALYQVGPELFDALSYVALRNAVLFGNTILEKQIFRQWEDLLLGKSTAACDYSKPHFWLQAVGELHRRSTNLFYNNVHGESGGLVGCVDIPTDENFVFGAAFSCMGNDTHVNSGGKIQGGDAHVGLYASYTRKHFFIDGLLASGIHWNAASRTISFNTINREAKSHQVGENVELHLQGGLKFLENLVPVFRISYIFNNQNGFNEHGADSLNLYVNHFNAHMLRTHLGVEFNNIIELSSVKIMPQINLAFIDEIPLDNRKINSYLPGIATTYAVYGLHKENCYFSGGIGLNLLFSKCKALQCRYDAEIKKRASTQAIKFGLEVVF